LAAASFYTGVRKGEQTKLNWDQVDFEVGVIALYETKNHEARAVPIVPGLMEDALRAAREEHDQFYPECNAVFANEGQRLMDLRRAWRTACEKAKVEGLLFHDMRRSANRNMRDAGLPQPMRMKIMGHKTASMDRRYGIVDLTDIQIARELLAKKPGKGSAKAEHDNTQKEKGSRRYRRGPPESSQQSLLIYNEVMGQPNRKTRAWVPTAKVVILRQSADALADVTPLLARVVEALGTNAAARMLGADRAQVSRWTASTESIGSEMGRRIVDLHDVLTRILRVYGREAAAMWLVGSEPLLGGARPIDILALEGAAPVIRAIDGISQGAYT
jgi:uncharacterized protein (DUF2384 family)